jgi:hypothetical protein
MARSSRRGVPVLASQELALGPMLRLELRIADLMAKSGIGSSKFSVRAVSLAGRADTRTDTDDMRGLSGLHTSSQTGHVLAFESEQRIPNATEPACGATKFLLPSAAMHLEREMAKKQCSARAFFAFACRLCAVLCFVFVFVWLRARRRMKGSRCVCSACLMSGVGRERGQMAV